MKNWKTTAAGIIVALVGFATYMGWITTEVAVAIGSLAGAIGLGLAKDNDVI
tara:strand:+ start:417 stop:572 length:156 start_codon:yes stop_codon:yes gene_type:complete